VTAAAPQCDTAGCPCACHRPVAVPLATRSMKARRPGTCPLCRGPILVGQSISKIVHWAHTTCVVEQHAAARAAVKEAIPT
jgi:hypothetical protein